MLTKTIKSRDLFKIVVLSVIGFGAPIILLSFIILATGVVPLNSDGEELYGIKAALLFFAIASLLTLAYSLIFAGVVVVGWKLYRIVYNIFA